MRQNGHAPAANCRVLIADDDENFAELLTLLLGEHSEINVVGRARDGAEAVELAATLKPDVVTMDLEMPRMNGIEATRSVRELETPPRVIIVSSSHFRDAIGEARRIGAHGYLSKSRVQQELVRVLFAVHRGEPFQELP